MCMQFCVCTNVGVCLQMRQRSSVCVCASACICMRASVKKWVHSIVCVSVTAYKCKQVGVQVWVSVRACKIWPAYTNLFGYLLYWVFVCMYAPVCARVCACECDCMRLWLRANASECESVGECACKRRCECLLMHVKLARAWPLCLLWTQSIILLWNLVLW